MTEEVQNETTAEISLNINDLAFMLKMIDVVTERGGFRGSELVNVGTIRNKLEAFLAANAQPAEEDAESGDDDAK